MSRPSTSPRLPGGSAASPPQPRAVAVRLLALGALALVALLGLALPASAAPASLHVTPSTVAAGRTVTVTGSCEANSAGWVISPAFFRDPTHEFGGLGAVSFTTGAAGTFTTHPVIARTTAPGRYSITARCGGGNLGLEVFVTVTAAPSGTPSSVPAGTGGQAATAEHGPRGAVILGGAGLLALAAGVPFLRRRTLEGSSR